jgi:Flp pilus assembly protein TadD
VGFALPMIRAWGMAPRQPAEAAIAELAPLQSMSGAGDLYAVMAGLLNEYYGRKAQALTEYDALAARIEQVPPSIVRLVAAGYRRLGKPEETVTLAKKLAAVRGASPLLDDLANSVVDPNAPRTVTAADGMAESLFGASQMLLQSVNSPFGVQLAVVYGQAALYLNPNLTIARRVVSVALAGRERFAEANAILAPIKKNEANYPSVQMQIADNYERMDKPDQALAVLEDIVKTHPTLPDAYIALGDHMRRIKRFEDAVKDYDQAAKLSPNGEPPQSWQFYYARGIALERSKQWDRADADLRKAIALKPDEASVLNYLGYSLIDRGLNLDEGRQLIEKALKLKPDDGYIIDSMGWALYLTGDMNGAVVHLEKAVETNPSDPTINEHLGDAYWKVGRKTEAYFQWRRALGLEPDDDQRTALQQKLAQGMARN